MKMEFKTRMKKRTALFLTLCTAAAAPVPSSALGAREVGYMPGVTEEMTDPAFWSGLTEHPDELLATPEEIALINEAILSAEGTNQIDLRNLKDTYNGFDWNEAQRKLMAELTEKYLGWTWDDTGKKLEKEDFDRIAANCIDSGAAEEMPVRWGICVNRTDLVVFPWDGQILDDPEDHDFDYQRMLGIRVNEPVAVYSASADGKYYGVSASCCSGWARAEDIAICKDREEWLSAWDIPAEKRLVFWGDRMYTDYSNSASETACRLITMGTVLERMEDTDPDALVINRLPLHNYAVYLPVRKADGSYGKVPALINARERVSEDYLPLTTANLSRVALASLGDAYGWGRGLYNEDCTSIHHSLFCCFGLDIPRDGVLQQKVESMPGITISSWTLEEKEALLDTLPLGTFLNFKGHQMMYLGKYAGNYYVVSTVSSVMSPWSGRRQRTRCCQINTLDTKRANGRTWMQDLGWINIPWVHLAEGEEFPQPELPAYHQYTAFALEKELIDPYPTGYFLANRAATRAEVIEMLWRTAGKPEPDVTGESFADTAAGSEHEKAALWARQAGIYAGEDGKFMGNSVLTQEFLSDVSRQFIGEDMFKNGSSPDTVLTRAELARAAQEVWAAYNAMNSPEAPSDTPVP